MNRFWENCEPDFVNEMGVKWWLDKECTQYARQENRNGIKLDGFAVWIVLEPNGSITRLLVNKDNEPVYDNPSIEGIGAKIDILKLQIEYSNAET